MAFMYCEIKRKEIELYEKVTKIGRKERILMECSENNKEISGEKVNSPCRFRFDERCLQVIYRTGGR